MADRIRLVILTDEELRAALKTEASARGVEMSELADSILREALKDALEEVRKRQEKKKATRPPRKSDPAED